MNSRLKRIIAREGLIILSFVAGSIILLFLDHLQSTHKSPRINYSEGELNEVLRKTTVIDDVTVRCSDGRNITFEKKPDKEDIFEACQAKATRDMSLLSDKQLYNELGTPLNKRLWFYRIQFLVLAFFLFFVAYPLYLIGRFVIWSVRTLKATHKN